MNHQPQISRDADGDPLADPAQLDDLAALDRSGWRLDRAQDERAAAADAPQLMAQIRGRSACR